MRIGVVKEVKVGERRVGLTPGGVSALVRDGHDVLVQSGAGASAGISDAAYATAGATLEPEAGTVWERSDLMVKVKEPIGCEYEHFRDDLTIFTYLHLAADLDLAEALVRSGVTAIAYETVTDADGRLPLLAPMSMVAGRLGALAGAQYLTSPGGGRGILMGGIAGAPPARVVVVGGGVAGTEAAAMAVGMEGDVTILERDERRMQELGRRFAGRVRIVRSEPRLLRSMIRDADLVIGAVLLPGARAPRLISRELLRSLSPGTVLVDIAIDQGGIAETSRPTTHAEPTYVVDGVVHYCVANMPAAVPSTSTRALTHVTLPHIRRLAGGIRAALANDPHLQAGLNVIRGEVTHLGVNEALSGRSTTLTQLA